MSADLEVSAGDLLSYLNKLVDRMIDAKNPLALPLLEMVRSLSSIHLSHEKGGEPLPERFDSELLALKLTVESQAKREIDENERMEWFLQIRLLFPRNDQELGEVLIEGLLASQSVGDLRIVIAGLIDLDVDAVLVKVGGELQSRSLDSRTLKELFGREVGEFVVNACSKEQGVLLGLVDFDDPIASELKTFTICVNVPSGLDLEQLQFEDIPLHTDLGEIRELIAEEIGVQSNMIILKNQGRFLFPSEDNTSLSEVFKSPGLSSAPVREVQLTAYSRESAIETGQIDDYTAQLISGRAPAGGIPIPFMRKASNALVFQFESEEEKRAIEQFIAEHRQKSTPESTRRSSAHSVDIHETITLAAPPSPIKPLTAPVSVKNPTVAPPPPPMAPIIPKEGKAKDMPMSKCRNLHWEKVKSVGPKTVWDHLPDFSLDTETLEKQFAKKQLKVKRVKPVLDRNVSEKAKIPDEKMAQNIEIMLRSLPPLPELVKAVVEIDSNVLSRDILELLSQNIPPNDSLEWVKSQDATFIQSGEPSVCFLYQVSQIEGWGARISAWRLSDDFEELNNSIKASAFIFRDSIGRILRNKSLLSILKVVLETGNHMNSGSYRGNAKGFRVDALLKLRSTKESQGNGTLLDYIVEQLKSKDIEALSFSHQIGPVLKKTYRITLVALVRALSLLESDLNTVTKECGILKPLLSADDPLHRLMDQFDGFSKELQKVSSILTEIQEECVRLLEYFGLSSKEAIKLFRELYPSDLANERKKNEAKEASAKEWTDDSIEELTETLLDTSKAREAHKGKGFDPELRKEREDALSRSRKALMDFVKHIDLDFEAIRDFKGLKNEISDLSESIEGLFRLLDDFSKHFTESVHKLLHPPKSPRKLKKRVKTQICTSISPRIAL